MSTPRSPPQLGPRCDHPKKLFPVGSPLNEASLSCCLSPREPPAELARPRHVAVIFP